MKLNKRIISIFLFLVFAGCTTGEQETTTDKEVITDSLEENDAPDSTVVSDEPDIRRPEVRFICRDIGQGLDNPLYEVSLLVENAYYTLDTIHTCNSILYRDYEEFEIPKYALTAAGGWWKNDGDYFFAAEQDGQIVVMHAWQTEEQSTQGYFYKVIRTIMLPEPVTLDDI